MSSSTIAEVFIIESLKLKDEEDGHEEGQLPSKMLHLSGKTKTKYFCIRTKKELNKIGVRVVTPGMFVDFHG